MKQFSTHLNAMTNFFVGLVLAVVVGSFIPVINIFVWVGAILVVLFYPLLHSNVVKHYQEQQEKEEIRQFNHKQALRKARGQQ